VLGEHGFEQLFVKSAAAHLNRGVLAAAEECVTLQVFVLVPQPVLGRPAVHHRATVHLVNGFTAEFRLGAVEQIKNIEALIGRQGRRHMPRIAHECRLPGVIS
jgi:hypothetical protein